MHEIMIPENDEITMKLLRYFIADKNYNPIIIKGIEGEIWLENLNEDYKIVRIVSNYIHNDTQFETDIRKTKQLMKQLKKKTLSLSMKALSIFVNLGDNVHMQNYENIPKISVAEVKKTEDLKKYNFIINSFPDITKKTIFKEKGLNLFMKLTGDIAKKNNRDASRNEDVFSMKKPIITITLIFINIFIFLLSGIYDLIGPFGVSRQGVLAGEFYRLFTGMFLHANMMHIVFNMYALYVIGSQLESFLGKFRYLIVYILGGVAGSVLSIFFSNGISVGASGAIFGLMGSLLYFGMHYRVYLETVVKSQIIPLILFNLLIGFMSPGIDNWAHIGGLIGGILSTMAVGIKYKSTKTQMINGTILYIIYTVFILYMVFNRTTIGM